MSKPSSKSKNAPVFPLLTVGQRDALLAYAAEKSRPDTRGKSKDWKRELSADWMFARARVNGEHSPELQQVRNVFGPSWLSKQTVETIRGAETMPVLAIESKVVGS